ncbi:MAG: glycosyltransferase family 2 protein [Oscillospiraceae bacterium]|nr:glycosyltransferase family 2 protein [Oscillospiraceae bacterium]
MNKQPFFTIGIPVYNTEMYIANAIDSVLSQSYTDFELIIVNDGSTDKSADIINQYKESDSRIKIINKPNGGLAAARNTMLYNAKGNYIIFIDSDDLMCEMALENAYNLLNNDSPPDILHAGFVRVFQGNETLCPSKYNKALFENSNLTKDEQWIEFIDMFNNDVGHVCAKFYNMEFIRREGLSFTERLGAQEDYNFICKTFRRANSMIHGDFYAYKYFKQRENSLSTEWKYKAVLGVLSQWADYFHATEVFNIGPEAKNKVAAHKKVFLNLLMNGTLAIAGKRTKEDCFRLIDLLDSYFGKDIKTIPITANKLTDKIIFRMYRMFGIKKTYRWLYAYLEMKGAVLKP